MRRNATDEPAVLPIAAARNLGPRQRRLRLLAGVVGLPAALVLAIALLAAGAPRVARLVVAPGLFLAAIGVLQYRAGT